MKLKLCYRVTTLQTEKIRDISLTFPDEKIADNISKKMHIYYYIICLLRSFGRVSATDLSQLKMLNIRYAKKLKYE